MCKYSWLINRLHIGDADYLDRIGSPAFEDNTRAGTVGIEDVLPKAFNLSTRGDIYLLTMGYDPNTLIRGDYDMITN
jgi:hypothetical protein